MAVSEEVAVDQVMNEPFLILKLIRPENFFVLPKKTLKWPLFKNNGYSFLIKEASFTSIFVNFLFKKGGGGRGGRDFGGGPGNRGPPRSQSGGDRPSFGDRGGDRPSFGGDRGNRSGGGGPGKGGGQEREGDWVCGDCSNKNFAWRNECNRCKAPKGDSGAAGGGGPPSGGGGGRFGGGGNRDGNRGSFGGGGNRFGGNDRGGNDRGSRGGGKFNNDRRGNDRARPY